MPVGELGHRMSARELTVLWPAYFRVRAAQVERAERDAELRRGR